MSTNKLFFKVTLDYYEQSFKIAKSSLYPQPVLGYLGKMYCICPSGKIYEEIDIPPELRHYFYRTNHRRKNNEEQYF